MGFRPRIARGSGLRWKRGGGEVRCEERRMRRTRRLVFKERVWDSGAFQNGSGTETWKPFLQPKNDFCFHASARIRWYRIQTAHLSLSPCFHSTLCTTLPPVDKCSRARGLGRRGARGGAGEGAPGGEPGAERAAGGGQPLLRALRARRPRLHPPRRLLLPRRPPPPPPQLLPLPLPHLLPHLHHLLLDTPADDSSALRTGEDFLNSSSSGAPPSIHLSDVSVPPRRRSRGLRRRRPAQLRRPGDLPPHDARRHRGLPRHPLLPLRQARPGAAAAGGSCDMAWRFRPKDAKRAAFYKDYRRFDIARSPNCTYSVAKIGDYHSGVNARKKKNKKPRPGSPPDADGFGPRTARSAEAAPAGAAAVVVPVVGDTVNDTLPVVESESGFSRGRYLIYVGGGDRCKSMNHYLWSFLCSLGEAQYLNRTLVMDLSICLNSMYTSTKQDEEGKDFRFYFDFEHLRDSASVLNHSQFWADWTQWRKKDRLSLHLVEDFHVTPMKLAEVKDTLIMRKFGSVEPDNYWYRVCEGETESVIQRPWHLLWKSRRLMDIVSGIASKMNWDFDAVHVVRGEKAKNTALWPNLAADTSPEALLATLGNKIDDGRHLYIATNEPGTTFFDPLKDKYTTHFLDDFKDLWGENSEWYTEMKNLNNGVPVEFDGYMRMEVDTEVFLRGRSRLRHSMISPAIARMGSTPVRRAPELLIVLNNLVLLGLEGFYQLSVLDNYIRLQFPWKLFL
uniref:O-fucosyltransferase family protein n=1 Tax=Ananas comosus var. bracteatus TaxID=296719 RepID=A0A6V7NR68_ANACO|nr:unnamed protein product [Ananas comosus var. bracteatus]